MKIFLILFFLGYDDTLDALADYPVLSDEVHSEVEQALILEHWDMYGEHMALLKLASALRVYHYDLSDNAREIIRFLTFSGELCGRFSNYPTFIDPSYVDFMPDEVIEWITARIGTIVTFRGRTFDLRRKALIEA